MPLLLAALLFTAQLPIPTALLPEQPVGEPPIVELGGGRLPHVASDETNFLVASTGSGIGFNAATYITLTDDPGRSRGTEANP